MTDLIGSSKNVIILILGNGDLHLYQSEALQERGSNELGEPNYSSLKSWTAQIPFCPFPVSGPQFTEAVRVFAHQFALKWCFKISSYFFFVRWVARNCRIQDRVFLGWRGYFFFFTGLEVTMTNQNGIPRSWYCFANCSILNIIPPVKAVKTVSSNLHQ